MANFSTIHNAKDYVNYVFNIGTRGVMESTAEIVGMSGTIQNVIGNLAFKTSEYLTNAETLSVGFGVAAVAAFSQATKQAIDFQQATANVAAISGKQLNAEEVGNQAMMMSSRFGMATADMTAGLEALARAGITAKDSISALLESGVAMSKFEGRDLEDSINDLISTVNLLNPDLDTNSMEFGEAVRNLNQKIVSTSESSPINAKNIIDSLQHVGGYASSTGLDQDDLFAVIAQLGAKGTKGEITGTSLRAFISAGQKDTAQRALDRIGLTVKDLWDESGNTILSLSQMKDVLDEALEMKGFSQQEKLEFYSDFVGYKQANQVMKIDTSETEYYRQKIDESLSLTEKMNIILGTVRGNWNQLVQSATNFLTKIGKIFLPIINLVILPIKSVMQFIDSIPFSEYIVGAGLGVVAIQGLFTAFNTLIPTMITFITKFADLENTSFSIKGMFDSIKESMQLTYNILKDIKDMNWAKINEITNNRESESTNKVLQERLTRESINEYFRQLYGLGDIYDDQGRVIGQYYKWDRKSRTEREYIMNKYRPDEKLIEFFTKKRTEAFDVRFANKDNPAPPSDPDFPSVEDWENEAQRRQTESQERTEHNVHNIYKSLQKIKNHTFDVNVVNKDFKSYIVDEPFHKNYNNKNVNYEFNPHTGESPDVKIPFERTYVPEAAHNGSSTWLSSNYGIPTTQQEMDKIIADWFKKGSYEASPRWGTLGPIPHPGVHGEAWSSHGEVRNFIAAIARSEPFSSDIRLGTSFLETFLHEVSHVVTLPDERKQTLNSTIPQDKDNRGHYIGPKVHNHYQADNWGTELESNISSLYGLRALGITKGTKSPLENVIAFGSLMSNDNRTGDIDMGIVSKYLNAFLENPFPFLNIWADQIENLNPDDILPYHPLAGGFQPGSEGQKKMKKRLKEAWDAIRAEVVAQYDILEEMHQNGFELNTLIQSRHSIATQSALSEQIERSMIKAQYAPQAYEYGPAYAAKRLSEEKERLLNKMAQFSYEEDEEGVYGPQVNDVEKARREAIKLNAYRKNFDASVMTQDAFDFAIQKNRRVLDHFLITGENRGFMKNQFQSILTKMATLTSLPNVSAGSGGQSIDPQVINELGRSHDMAEFTQKYNTLSDAAKAAVREVFLLFGESAAEDRLNSKEAWEVNKQRRGLILKEDYSNLADALGIDFSQASTQEERYNVLQDWLKGAGKGREDDVARVLMMHDDKLARTMEGHSVAENVAFISHLKQQQLISQQIYDDLIKTNQNGDPTLTMSRFAAFNYLRKNLFDNATAKDAIYGQAKNFFGGFSEFGQAAMYELGLHFEEMKVLADRAGVTIDDIQQILVPGVSDMFAMPFTMPIPIPVDVINMPDFPNIPTGVHVTPTDDDGNPIPPAGPTPLEPGDYGPHPKEGFDEPMFGPSGADVAAAHDDVIRQIEDIYDPDKLTRVQKWGKRFNEIIDKVLTTLGGTIDEQGNHIAGNRFSQKLDDFFARFDGAFGNSIVGFAEKSNNFIHLLEQWQFAFQAGANIFPPFIAVVQALGFAINITKAVTEALIIVESTLSNMRNLEGMFSIFEGTRAAPFIKQLEKRISGVFDAATAGIKMLINGVWEALPILGPIVAVIAATVAALKISQSSHDEYLKTLKEEGKVLQQEDQAAQTTYENARKQMKGRKDNTAQAALLEEHYRLAEIKLNSTNQKRLSNLLKQSGQEDDMLWGNYGLRASVQKTGWFESIFSMGVPFVGTIAKALAGEFESEIDAFEGTTGRIRQIKEQTIGTPNMFGPQPTAAQRQVAAYYDAHRAAFATIDNYKNELGTLYDFETKLIKGMGSKERARASKAWTKELNRVSKLTGLTGDQLEEYLDYMQIEHTTSTAANAMQAHADQITANAELQAMAIANGASVEDAMGLNGLEAQQKVMVEAQADMIRQQASSDVWWKAFWSGLASIFWQIVSPITIIATGIGLIVSTLSNLDVIIKEAIWGVDNNWSTEDRQRISGWHTSLDNFGSALGDTIGAGKAGREHALWSDTYDKLQQEDFYNVGQNAVSDLDRHDYGNGGATRKYMSTSTATLLTNGGMNVGQVSDADSTSRGEITNASDEGNWFTNAIFGKKTNAEKQEEAQQKLADEKQARMEKFNVQGTEQEGIWRAVSILESIDFKLGLFGTLGLGMGGIGLLGGMGGQGGIFGTHGIGSLKTLIEDLKNSEITQKIETTIGEAGVPEWLSNSTDYLGEKASGLWDKAKENGLPGDIWEKVKSIDTASIRDRLSNFNLGSIKDSISNINLGSIKDSISNVNLGSIKDRLGIIDFSQIRGLGDKGREALDYLLPNTSQWASEKIGLLKNTIQDARSRIGGLDLQGKGSNLLGNLKNLNITGKLNTVKDKVSAYMPKYPLSSYLDEFKLNHQGTFNRASMIKDSIINYGEQGASWLHDIGGNAADYIGEKAGDYGGKIFGKIKDSGLYQSLSKDLGLNKTRLGGWLQNKLPGGGLGGILTTMPTDFSSKKRSYMTKSDREYLAGKYGIDISNDRTAKQSNKKIRDHLDKNGKWDEAMSDLHGRNYTRMGRMQQKMSTVYHNYNESDSYTYGDLATDLIGDEGIDKITDRVKNPGKLKGDFGKVKNSKLGKKLGSSRIGKGVSKGVGRIGGKIGKSAVGGVAKAGAKGVAKMGGKLLGKVGGRLAGMEIGAALGSVVPGLGTVIGAGVGFLAGELIGAGVDWLLGGGGSDRDANGHKKSATRGNASAQHKGIGGALSGLGKWIGGGVSRAGKTITGGAHALGKAVSAPFGAIGSLISGGSGMLGKGASALLSATPMGLGIQALHSITAKNEEKRAKDFAEGKELSKQIKAHTGNTSESMKELVEKVSNGGNGGSVVIENVNIYGASDPEAIKTELMKLIIELKDQVSPRTVGRTIGSINTETTTETENTDSNSTDNNNTNNNGDSSNSPTYY